MTEIQFLMIPHAPKPIAPYSHVVEVDGGAFITGQLDGGGVRISRTTLFSNGFTSPRVLAALPERLCFRAWSAIRRLRAGFTPAIDTIDLADVGLTLKQEKFVHAYLATGNAMEAYRRSYDCERMGPKSIETEAPWDYPGNPALQAQ